MSDPIEFLDLMERAEQQRRARRGFIRLCGGAAAMTGGLALLSGCGNDDGGPSPTPSPTPTPSGAVTDVAVLNFALQLEYLEGAYYAYAVSGSGVDGALLGGMGTQGTVVTGSGAGAARAVDFSDDVVAEYAREIAADEIGHIRFLRETLGSARVAQPAINISGSASVDVAGTTAVGAFTAAARAAGVIGAGDIFDPYASDENFLIGAYLLTDVGVSAYRGAAKLLSNKTYLEASAGLLAAECYHDATIRAELWRRGLTVPSVYTRVSQISALRDSLDGAGDTDQDIGTASTANLVPTDSDGLVLGRSAAQVLNVVFQNGAAVTGGGFFPAGLNGTILTSGTAS
ncbi:ferritin-like domain-containing protein [Sphingomonas yunnanensis]|uniref:ferritin-like domain-containing protein n=1 Tax=Sphingomonas yunnanensis TaxID=310400 RepID=UPI001CA60CCB|nr:ferritin-like domain-containing protein [Sphingomonas yunnanensis]MBY9062945.1 ferritin-like domain-containing protein [Sphingomonas yunnanensis]